MPLGLDLVGGLALLVATALVLVVGRTLVAIARGEDPREAVEITGRWSASILGAAGAAGAMGLVELADVLGMVVAFIGSHPLAVSNGLVTGLGAAVSGGIFSPTPEQFVGIALMLVGLTMVVYNVGDDR